MPTSSRRSPPHIDRRSLLVGGAALAGAAAFAPLVWRRAGGQLPGRTIEPRETEFELVAGMTTRALLSYSDRGPAPELRVRQGEPAGVRLLNRMEEPTTIHWHGIRLPNAMDGVPFLTQAYVHKGETFDYAFTPPDAGTYWYHPHCNSLAQMSRGLGGLLIVEERRDPGFDADIALNLRDWRLGADGQLASLFVPRQAARGGTSGAVHTANWRQAPAYDAPSGGLVRLRLVATDVTRIYRPATEGAGAIVIALDGNPLDKPRALAGDTLAPGQRMDLVVAMPNDEGRTVALRDLASQGAAVLATLSAAGASRGRDLRDVAALPANPIPQADTSAVSEIALDLTATAEQVARSAFCGDLGYSFWAINGRPWPGSSPDPLAPLAELKLGSSYILVLHNRTPHAHPIHLHGMSFRLLRSDRRELPAIATDTVLVLPDERVAVGLLADNPGDWLLHCHVIEHQETGMTGFIRVT
jgi:FtsP/CotA-like multicopper oxidase with cupredoxin domain